MNIIKANGWYVNILETNHMCGEKNVILKLSKIIRENMLFEDEFKVLVDDEDKILIHLKNSQFILNVYLTLLYEE